MVGREPGPMADQVVHHELHTTPHGVEGQLQQPDEGGDAWNGVRRTGHLRGRVSGR